MHRYRESPAARLLPAAAGRYDTGMFPWRLDKSLRVACSLGLLWLLGVQEKLCPWLVATPQQIDQQAAPRDPASGPPAEPEKRPKPRLPHVVPDTPALRWPAGWLDQTLRQTAGDRDGVVSCGKRDPSTRGAERLPAAAGDPLAWRALQWLGEPVGAVCEETPPSGVGWAIRTCISRTGPPRAA